MSKPSLSETHPELAKQWHPTKNGELTPNDVTPGSSKIVWWKCDKADDCMSSNKSGLFQI